MKLLLTLVLGALLLPAISVAEELIKVGQKTFEIPLPEGFVKFSGLNPRIDKLMQSLTPPSNRSLMVIATPKDAANAAAENPTNLARYMMVQTFRESEKIALSVDDFKQVASEFEKSFGKKKALEDMEKEVNQQFKKAQPGVKLVLSQTVMLGVYDKSERSIDAGMLAQSKVENNKAENMAVAMSIVLLDDKLVYLYVYADLTGPKDVEWTRTTLKGWRESVLKVNSK
jgi:hypothetical protein